MLEFESILFRNLGSYGDRAFEFNFRESRITAFVGTNGTGKSTLIEALAFVLYGKAWRGVSKAELVNKTNKRGTYVEVHFTTPKGQFKVVRGIKPDVFEIWQDGTLLNQDSKSRDYQKTLETEILGLTWDAFNQVIVIGKASYTPFMKLKTDPRRAFVESILSLQIFSAMKEVRRLQGSAADKSLLTSQTRLTSTQPRVEIASRNIENYKGMLSAPGTVSMADIGKELEGYRNDYARLVREEREIIYERENVVNAASAIWRDAVKAQQAVIAAADKVVADLRATANTLDADVRAVKAFMDQCTSDANSLRRQASSLDTRDSCPTCGGPIDATTVRRHADELERQAVEHEATRESARPDLEAAQAARTAFEPQIEAAVKAASVERDKLVEINMQDPASGRVVLDDLVEIDQRLAAKKAECTEVQGKMNIADSEYKAAHRREVELVALLKQAEDDFAKASSEVAELTIEQQKAHSEVQVLNVIASILKDTGAKATIIRRYIPVINGIVNELLANMGLFAKFELDEEFNDKILIRGFEEMTYNGLSEGEKLRIDMAVMMAWRELCILTGSSSSNLLVFDEIFDASFDEQGLDAFMQYIAERDDLNVVTMTHHPDRIDHYIDRILRFRREDGYSIYEVET